MTVFTFYKITAWGLQDQRQQCGRDWCLIFSYLNTLINDTWFSSECDKTEERVGKGIRIK